MTAASQYQRICFRLLRTDFGMGCFLLIPDGISLESVFSKPPTGQIQPQKTRPKETVTAITSTGSHHQSGKPCTGQTAASSSGSSLVSHISRDDSADSG